jgi:hypothetical protein
MATVTPNFNFPVPQSTDLVKDGATAIASLGTSIDTQFVDLKGGTTGQVLAKASNTDLDYSWVTTDDTNAIQNAIVDAKGDLIAASATDTPARLAVGANGTMLLADSSTTTGLRWQDDYAAGKNKIINGNFNIWQRGTTFTNPNGAYTADRFAIHNSVAVPTFTVTQQTFTPGAAPVTGYESQYFMRLAVTAIGTSGGQFVRQNIEDVRTFANQTMTISFWAKYDTTRNVDVSIVQNFGSGGSSAVASAAQTISVTSSWARYSATFVVPSVSGKTIGTSSYLEIDIKTAAANYTFDVWGVQVEAGSVATAFQTASGSVQGELALCQRYYQRITAAGQTSTRFAVGFVDFTTGGEVTIPFAVEMRTRPTALEQSGTAGDYTVRSSGGTNTVCNVVPVFTQAGLNAISISFGTAAVLVAGQAAALRVSNTSGYLGWSAEL